jgi:hypothetical protein
MNRHLARSSTTSARYSPIRIGTRPNRWHLHPERFLDKSLHRVLMRWPGISPGTQTTIAAADEPDRPERRVLPVDRDRPPRDGHPGRARSTSAGSGLLTGRARWVRRPDFPPVGWGHRSWPSAARNHAAAGTTAGSTATQPPPRASSPNGIGDRDTPERPRSIQSAESPGPQRPTAWPRLVTYLPGKTSRDDRALGSPNGSRHSRRHPLQIVLPGNAVVRRLDASPGGHSSMTQPVEQKWGHCFCHLYY